MQHLIWLAIKIPLLFWAAMLALVLWVITISAAFYVLGAISKMRANDKKAATPAEPKPVNKDLQ